jgi:hypothetical protein
MTHRGYGEPGTDRGSSGGTPRAFATKFVTRDDAVAMASRALWRGYFSGVAVFAAFGLIASVAFGWWLA